MATGKVDAMKPYRRIALCLLLAMVFLPRLALGLEPVPIEDKRELEGSYKETKQTAYLSLEVQKYDKVYTGSSESSPKTIDVLEWTDWDVTATFVVVENGAIVERRPVTSNCAWKSTDKSGKTVSISGKGKVKAGTYNGYKYTVSASYSGTVYNIKRDDEGNVVSKEPVRKDCEAKMYFNVKRLGISSEGLHEMRAMGFAELVGFDRWRSSMLSQYLGKTVRTYIDDLQRNEKLATIYNSHILRSNIKNSATKLHFISAIAADYEVMLSSLTQVPSDPDYEAVALKQGGQVYIAYSSEDDGKSRREHALEFYDQVEAQGDNNIIVIGVGKGGSLAQYVSYLRGCRATTFGVSDRDSINLTNEDAPITKAIHDDLESFCATYNGMWDPGIQKNYEYDTSSGWGSTETKRLLPTVFYCRNQGSTTSRFGTAGFLSYDKSSERVSLSDVSTMKAERNTSYSRFHTFNYVGPMATGYASVCELGSESEDVVVSNGYANKYVFGGDGDDVMRLEETDLSGFWIKIGVDSLGAIGSTIKTVYGNTVKEITGTAAVLKNASDVYDYFKIVCSAVNNFKKHTLNTADWIMDMGQPLHYVIPGRGDDYVYFGSYSDDYYCYTYGDGHDEIIDLSGYDRFYLMGCEDRQVDVEQIRDEHNEVCGITILIDGEAVINCYFQVETMSEATLAGTIEIYRGVPGGKEEYLYQVYRLSGKVRTYRIACPVDVHVYDANGQLVQELKDGAVYEGSEEYGSFEVVKEGSEYVKYVCLYDDGYQVRIRGRAEGTMDYEALSRDESGRIRSVCVSDVPVTPRSVYSVPSNIEEGLQADWDGDGENDETLTDNAEVVLSERELDVSLGERHQLEASIHSAPADSQIAWKTTDESVVSVDDQGLVTAVGEGHAEVYAMLAFGEPHYDVCKVTVSATGLSADDFEVAGIEQSYAYTGEIIAPEPQVAYRGLHLVEGTDYTLEYSEYVNPGEVTLTITGTGRFEGAREVTYEIEPPQVIMTAGEKVSAIVAQCRAAHLDDEYAIAVWLHDWLTENANYDYTYTYYYADGVLLQQTGVCQSYTLAYASLLDAFGIENQMVTSPEMDHAWNLVKLDGQWCHVDCTWDDPGVGGAENHTYFGASDALLSRDHTWDAAEYPASTTNANYYPIRMGLDVFSNDDELGALLAKSAADQVEDIECYYVGDDADYSLWDSLQDWCARWDWKYGIMSYGVGGTYVHMAYGEPWEEPAVFTGIAPCPLAVLRGPGGTYDLSDYKDNGIVFIYGRVGCLNTRGLLDRLHERTDELRATGVEVMVCLEGSSSPEDIATVSDVYPKFCYVYEEPLLVWEMTDAIGVSPNTLPFVFFVNKNSMITYFSEGYVDDIDAFIEQALNVSTGSSLPEPGKADEEHDGAVFRYTGDEAALKAMMRDALARKRTHIAVKDEAGDGSEEREDEFIWHLYETVWDLREYDCDFTWPRYYDSYPTVVLSIGQYGAHDEVEDPAVEPTCTESGLTKGSHCSICGKVIKEQEVLSPLGHSMTFHERVDSTCTTDGAMAHYECADCGGRFLDEDGDEAVVGSLAIPAGHDFGTWTSNGDGTHTATCRRDASHIKKEKCSYTYSVVREATQGEPERGRYTCEKCGYSYDVVRMEPTSATIRLTGGPFVYDGKEKRPKVQIDGLAEGTDFDVRYENNVNAGTATAIVTGKGNYTGTASATFAIEKAANPMTAKAERSSVSAMYSAGAATTFGANVKVGATQGTVSFSNASDDATARGFSIDARTGQVTLPQGTAAGTYTVVVKANAAGNANFKAGSKAVSYKVVVVKADNGLAVKAKTVSLKASKLARKKQTVSAKKAYAVSNANGGVTYKLSSVSKKKFKKFFSVSKSGKVTVKKSLGKGTYKLKVKVTAAGDANHEAATRTVTVKVKVR